MFGSCFEHVHRTTTSENAIAWCRWRMEEALWWSVSMTWQNGIKTWTTGLARVGPATLQVLTIHEILSIDGFWGTKWHDSMPRFRVFVHKESFLFYTTLESIILPSAFQYVQFFLFWIDRVVRQQWRPEYVNARLVVANTETELTNTCYKECSHHLCVNVTSRFIQSFTHP